MTGDGTTWGHDIAYLIIADGTGCHASFGVGPKQGAEAKSIFEAWGELDILASLEFWTVRKGEQLEIIASARRLRDGAGWDRIVFPEFDAL